MGVVTVVTLLFLGVLGSYALHDIPDRYDIALNLRFDGFPQAATFKFFYTYDRENQMLRMAVKVLSLGWVGIGFSRNAFMTDTDVAIGWVDSSGNGYLQVSYKCVCVRACVCVCVSLCVCVPVCVSLCHSVCVHT